jgi:hypothetical protein
VCSSDLSVDPTTDRSPQRHKDHEELTKEYYNNMRTGSKVYAALVAFCSPAFGSIV